jgi:hypothetical protein
MEKICIAGLALVPGFTAWAHGGFLERELNWSLLALGLLTAVYWAGAPRGGARLSRWLLWPVALRKSAESVDELFLGCAMLADHQEESR